MVFSAERLVEFCCQLLLY